VTALKRRQALGSSKSGKLGVGGRQYYYRQTSKRVGGKVVTTSEYIGPTEPRRRLMPTLGEILRGLLAGGVQIGAFELQKAVTGKKEKEHKSRPTTLSARSVDAQHEQWYRETSAKHAAWKAQRDADVASAKHEERVRELLKSVEPTTQPQSPSPTPDLEAP